MISNGRFRLSKTAENMPNKCIVCGGWGGDGRHFIDFGFDIDYYGTVYFCSVCFTEAASNLGYLSPDRYKHVTVMNEELIQRIQRLEAENVHLRSIADSVNFLRRDYSSIDDSEVSETASPTADDATSTSSEQSTVLHGEDNNGKKSNDSKSDGPFDERGSEDVSSNDKYKRESSFSEFL